MFPVYPESYYTIECWRRGVLVWVDQFHNLVTTAGRNKLLDATIKTGLVGPTWYVGLVNNASFSAYAAADTMGSHGGWLEATPYSNVTRPAYTPGAIASASVNNIASPATFNINASLTIRGGFLTDSSTKGGTTGTLYGVGDFSASRIVIVGDLISAKITLTC